MQTLAKDTNANTEDTLKLSTTFIGLGDTAKSAVGKTEALVKANQAFGGTGEQLKGVVRLTVKCQQVVKSQPKTLIN